MPLPAHDYSIAIGLNDHQVVAGNSRDLASGEHSVVVWHVGQDNSASASALPGLPGEPSPRNAIEINNEGMIAGLSWSSHAVVWTGSPGAYVPHDLGTLGSTYGASSASSLSDPDSNGNVWVVGSSYTELIAGERTVAAVLWQVDPQGNVISMTNLDPTASDADANDVRVIDGAVIVVGTSDVNAVVWETDLSGTVTSRTELGTANYEAVNALALNHSGDVVGFGFEPGSSNHAFFYEDGLISDLGTLGNSQSRAYGINDDDMVVGQYQKVRTKGFYQVEDIAFVWEDGAMYDLIKQVPGNQFSYLYSAYDIGASGEIVGNGRLGKKAGSEEHGYMAIPEGHSQQPPAANDDAFVVAVDGALAVSAPGVLDNDSDADGDSLSAQLVSGPASAQSFSLAADGSITYIPIGGFMGADSFTYVANDGLADSNLATVSITVSPPSTSDAIYVYDIRFESKRGNKDWRAVFEIRSDSNGNGAGDAADSPIAGVQVEVTFAGNTYKGVTDSNGIFRTSWIKNLSSGNYYANAVDLALKGYQWDPLTIDLEDDSDEIFGPDDLLVR